MLHRPMDRSVSAHCQRKSQTKPVATAFLRIENEILPGSRKDGLLAAWRGMHVHLEDVSLPRAAMSRGRISAEGRLLERLRQGDAEAGRRFVREYYPSVYRYLLYLTGRAETADDLTQETFVQAWRSLNTLDERAHFRPWLHRIAHREFLQALR